MGMSTLPDETPEPNNHAAGTDSKVGAAGADGTMEIATDAYVIVSLRFMFTPSSTISFL